MSPRDKEYTRSEDRHNQNKREILNNNGNSGLGGNNRRSGIQSEAKTINLRTRHIREALSITPADLANYKPNKNREQYNNDRQGNRGGSQQTEITRTTETRTSNDNMNRNGGRSDFSETRTTETRSNNNNNNYNNNNRGSNQETITQTERRTSSNNNNNNNRYKRAALTVASANSEASAIVSRVRPFSSNREFDNNHRGNEREGTEFSETRINNNNNN